MAKSKAELESEHRRYRGAICKLQRALDGGDYPLSIREAVDAWEYIDGMIQYENRFLGRDEFPHFECIDAVLQYAPLLFDQTSLDKLESLLKSARRVERYTAQDIAQQLGKSRSLLKFAHLLWNYLCAESQHTVDDCRSAFQGDDSDFHKLLRVWGELQLLGKSDGASQRSIRLRGFGDSAVRAKCPACARISPGTLSHFLADMRCPSCHATEDIVFLS